MQDPAFFLTKLCHAASRHCLSQGNAAEALNLQNDSIKMIQERLESNDIGDYTVSAVTGMVCNEVRRFDLGGTVQRVESLPR